MKFLQWHVVVEGRTKTKQILDVVRDWLNPGTTEYVYSMCFTHVIRDHLLNYSWMKSYFDMRYGDLVELVANILLKLEKPILAG